MNSITEDFYKKFLNREKIDEFWEASYDEEMCKISLEHKFSRPFPLQEIKQIIEDTSWQWRTPEQELEFIQQRIKTNPDVSFKIY